MKKMEQKQYEVLVDKMFQIKNSLKQTSEKQRWWKIQTAFWGEKFFVFHAFTLTVLLILNIHLSFYPFGLVGVSTGKGKIDRKIHFTS